VAVLISRALCKLSYAPQKDLVNLGFGLNELATVKTGDAIHPPNATGLTSTQTTLLHFHPLLGAALMRGPDSQSAKASSVGCTVVTPWASPTLRTGGVLAERHSVSETSYSAV
jgi:hypothetical protein